MNIPFTNDLIAALRAEMPPRFRWYFPRILLPEPNACGCAGCAIGLIGITPKLAAYVDCDIHSQPLGYLDGVYKAIDLPECVASHIFDTEGYSNFKEVTPGDVAERLQRCLDLIAAAPNLPHDDVLLAALAADELFPRHLFPFHPETYNE